MSSGKRWSKNNTEGEERMFSRNDLIKLMIPLIVEQILAVLVGMADVVMVASVGEAAVSGVSLVDSINILLIQLLSAMATGGAVVAAQYLGNKDETHACMAANQLLLFNTVFSLAVMAIVLIFNKGMLRLIFGSIADDVMYNAEVYFQITALSFPFLAVYNSCAALYRSMGNSKISMYTSLVMNGINIAGNALCVFGLGMGVEGVAYPTLVSRAVAALIILWLVRNPQNKIHVDSRLRLGFHPRMIRRILKIGVPNGLENSMFQFGKLMIQSLVSTLGTSSIAAFAVASNIVTIEYLPGNALGLGLITVVGQCVGAGEFQQAEEYTKKIIKVNYIILAVVATGLAFLSTPVAGIYNLSPEASNLAVSMIVVHSIAMLIWPTSFTLPNVLRAASDVKFTMVISVFSMWAFRIGFSYLFILGFKMNIMGIWFAMFVDWLFRDACFIPRFLRGKWKKYPSI